MNKKLQTKEATLIRRKVKGMKKFIVQLSCGCCDSEVFFYEEQTLIDQMQNAGFSVSASITDDLGIVVENVDTFYGYRTEKESQRSLEYLIEKLTK